MSSLRRYSPLLTLAVGIISLYLFGLTKVGVLDPDEPRYLSIGRAMAQTHDFVMPRLWGAPWFEKPPLLYWMTASGALIGLGPEASGRLPVALLSLVFLAVMLILLRREFGVAGVIAPILLATSVGWVAYSDLALTDIPLAVFFSLAVFLALPLVETASDPRAGSVLRWLGMGASLGMATLAKGLVPLVLAVPALWCLRHGWRRWIFAAAGLFAVALPWYLAMYVRSGRIFLDEFFWKQHFERLYSTSIQHVQPWWYYLPVFVGALCPWTPLLFFLTRPGGKWDRRRKFLAATIGFGILFFSVSLNKLPGYLLPLLPLPFALLASVASAGQFAWPKRGWLLACAVLIGLLPWSALLLEQSLQAGRIALHEIPHTGATVLFYMLTPIVVAIFARRSWANVLLVLCFVASGFYIKITALPILEKTISPRAVWERVKDAPGKVCNDWIDRYWAYGLAFYRGAQYPLCTDGGKYDYALRSTGRQIPALVKKQEAGSKN